MYYISQSLNYFKFEILEEKSNDDICIADEVEFVVDRLICNLHIKEIVYSYIKGN